MQAFPDEIIDLIVANTNIDFVATFMLVCKKYLHLFDRKHKSQILYMKETPFDGYKDKYEKLYRKWALYQNPFTKVSPKKMIKYVPFGNPKFDKTLLDKTFLSHNGHIIRGYQDLKSVNIYNKIIGDIDMWDLRFVYNYNYDVFCELAINPPTRETISYVYNGSIYTRERMEFLLANKILCPVWDRFPLFGGDLDMYKKIYQMHIENGVHPIWQCYIRYILSINLPIVEWLIPITDEKINSEYINKSNIWKAENIVYLYERGILSDIWIWENVSYSASFEDSFIDLLSTKIPFPSLEILFGADVHPKVIIAKCIKNSPMTTLKRLPRYSKYMPNRSFGIIIIYKKASLGTLGLTKEDLIDLVTSSNCWPKDCQYYDRLELMINQHFC